MASRGVLRVYLEDHVVLRQLGLHNTFKTLPVDDSATAEVVHQKMIKTMSRGMTPAQVQVIEEHCDNYKIVEVFEGNSKQLEPEQIPWKIFQENQKITFYFRPPQEDGATTESGEAVVLIAEEVLNSFKPLHVWGFTSLFAGRFKSGIATLDDLLHIVKHRREAELHLMKGLQKGMQKVSSTEKGTIGKAWSGVLGQQNQIVFLHQQMANILGSHILKPIETLKSKLDHEKSRIYKNLSEDEKALKTLMDRSARLKKKYHECSEKQDSDEVVYVRAKNDPMSDPKSLAEYSQAAEKSKKIAEEARKEYKNHLEKAKEEHPQLIKKIQDNYKELQKLEWERLSSVARVLEIFVEQHEKLFADFRLSNKQVIAVVKGINPEDDVQTFIGRNKTGLSPEKNAVFEEWRPGNDLISPASTSSRSARPLSVFGGWKDSKTKDKPDKESTKSAMGGIFKKKKDDKKESKKEKKDKSKPKLSLGGGSPQTSSPKTNASKTSPRNAPKNSPRNSARLSMVVPDISSVQLRSTRSTGGGGTADTRTRVGSSEMNPPPPLIVKSSTTTAIALHSVPPPITNSGPSSSRGPLVSTLPPPSLVPRTTPPPPLTGVATTTPTPAPLSLSPPPQQQQPRGGGGGNPRVMRGAPRGRGMPRGTTRVRGTAGPPRTGSPAASVTAPPPPLAVASTNLNTGQLLKVLFDYNPTDFEEGVDLRLKMGEVVTLVQQVDGQWYKGRKMNGQEGILPINFVEKLVKKTCKATFGYDAKDTDELTLKVGDIVTITEEIEGWLRGCNNRGECGMFPATFVEIQK